MSRDKVYSVAADAAKEESPDNASRAASDALWRAANWQATVGNKPEDG